MISIIVPVYNAEDYLEEAILSVFSQTCKDWELILVDDGSTDSSPEICDRTQAQSSNVRVIHKANGGLSSARNAGIKIARGEFLLFLDADDILPRHSLQLLQQTALRTNADIVCGSAVKFYSVDWLKNHNGDNIPDSTTHMEEFSYEDAIREVLYQNKIDNSAWSKLYVRKIWDNISFRENTWYEDLDVFYRVFEHANKVVRIESVVYFYRQHSGSYLHNFNLRRADVLDVAERLVRYMTDNNPSLLPAAKSRRLSANFNILGLIAANGVLRDMEAARIADKCWEKIKELRSESLRNPNVRIKNKIGILVSYLFGRKGLEVLSKLAYKS